MFDKLQRFDPRNVRRVALMLCFFLMWCALCGCMALNTNPEDLELHGKVGRACAFGTGIISGPLYALAIPFMGLSDNGDYDDEDPDPGDADDKEDRMAALSLALIGLGAGAAIEYPTYYVTAGLAYPIHYVWKALPGRLALGRISGAALVEVLLSRMPNVSEREYGRLVPASGRQYAPDYREVREAFPSLPRFGRRPKVRPDIAQDWLMWHDAGRPAGGAKEAEAVLAYWVMGGDAGVHFVRLHGAGMGSILEDILGVTESQVRDYGIDRRGADALDESPGMWKFWVIEHGGVEAVVRERF